MSISKEIFGIEKEDLNDCPMGLRDYGHGFNDALIEVDEFEISEEELEKIVDIALKDRLDFMDKSMLNIKNRPRIPRMGEFIAKAIKQNQHRIFVRKTK